jgi:hypothetical protein
MGQRIIAEAIVGNESSSLSNLWGVELGALAEGLGLPDSLQNAENEAILSHMHQMRLSALVKSARGGVRL